jgi:hypothetical protein
MIAVYVDDLAISMEEPEAFLEVLKMHEVQIQIEGFWSYIFAPWMWVQS